MAFHKLDKVCVSAAHLYTESRGHCRVTLPTVIGTGAITGLALLSILALIHCVVSQSIPCVNILSHALGKIPLLGVSCALIAASICLLIVDTIFIFRLRHHVAQNQKLIEFETDTPTSAEDPKTTASANGNIGSSSARVEWVKPSPKPTEPTKADATYLRTHNQYIGAEVQITCKYYTDTPVLHRTYTPNDTLFSDTTPMYLAIVADYRTGRAKYRLCKTEKERNQLTQQDIESAFDGEVAFSEALHLKDCPDFTIPYDREQEVARMRQAVKKHYLQNPSQTEGCVPFSPAGKEKQYSPPLPEYGIYYTVDADNKKAWFCLYYELSKAETNAENWTHNKDSPWVSLEETDEDRAVQDTT